MSMAVKDNTVTVSSNNDQLNVAELLGFESERLSASEGCEEGDMKDGGGD